MDEQKNIVIKRIIELLKEQNKQKKDLCEYLGVSATNFGNWVSGRNTSYMKYTHQMAQYFGVSVDYLLGYEQKNIPQDVTASEDEKVFIELFRKLSPEKRQMLINMLKIALAD
jgi:transcriptional regulator with XRE-family HTH domain